MRATQYMHFLLFHRKIISKFTTTLIGVYAVCSLCETFFKRSAAILSWTSQCKTCLVVQAYYKQTMLVWAIFLPFFDTKCQQNHLKCLKNVVSQDTWLESVDCKFPPIFFQKPKGSFVQRLFFRLFKNFIPCSPHLLSYFLTLQDVLCKSCQKVRKSYPVHNVSNNTLPSQLLVYN